MKPPCLRFKPNAARVVKLLGLGCFLILATALGPSRARAQDAQDPLDSIDAAQAPTPPAESGLTTPSVPGDVGGELPKIRARTFPARVLKKSRSAKMYLFDDPGEEVPPTGKIILLKKDGVPTMALRVLKTYPENNHYAAKRVRTYNETQVLNEGDSFDAVEKMGDIAPVPPPVTTPQDKADLNELEGGTGTGSGPGTGTGSGSGTSAGAEATTNSATPPPAGNDLGADLENTPPSAGADTGAPAASAGGPATVSPEEEREIDRQLEGLEIDENDDFTPTYQWLTVGAGLFATEDFATVGKTYFMGGGARYQLDLGHRLIFSSGSAQDAISLEGGVYYYSIAGYAEVDPTTGQGVDSYTVIPLVGNIKYTVWIDPDFALFGYVGLVHNLVTVVTPPTNPDDGDLAVQLLSANTTSFGGGAMFRIGPSWYARVDAGTDFIGAGLVISF